MKKDLTEVIFILDRSGSMAGLEDDTIGGYNGMIKKQKALDGDVIVTTVLFDDEYELLHDRIGLMGIEPISEKDYYVRGTTALLDAIGKSINKIINVQKNTARDERAEKVMFVITTDGMENASREYTYDRIKAMIEHQKERYNWEFLFLGANIDAVETAAKFGIDRDRATNFHSDKIGSAINYQIISETVQAYRESNTIPSDWKKEIEEDYKRRS